MKKTRGGVARGRARLVWMLVLGTALAGALAAVRQALLPGGALSARALYTDAVGGFSLAYPAPWSVLRNHPSTDVVLLPPRRDDDAFQDNVNVRHLQAPATQAAAQARHILDTLQAAGADVTLLEQADADALGQGAIKLVYTMRVQDQELAMISYIVQHGDTYFLTCTTLPQRLAQFRQACEGIAHSFRVTRD